ncbi:(2Fe-2S)-binding protein [Pelagibacterium sp.]|uniref:(2Fe-2S)-binding protein n=1 Tax=Pelagibacterium sp. TaxID=1967288 RepID=UPI003BA9EAC5
MRFRRLSETKRRPVNFRLDGQSAAALEGDTLLVAMLTNIGHVRCGEFLADPRAGFCMMGACHDCMVWRRDGGAIRACTTPVTDDLDVVTCFPEAAWPKTIS